jgi:hypothetical protein
MKPQKLFIGLSRYVMNPSEIKAHDDEVFKNWTLLSKGKLEISEELGDHLAQFSDTIALGARLALYFISLACTEIVNGLKACWIK